MTLCLKSNFKPCASASGLKFEYKLKLYWNSTFAGKLSGKKTKTKVTQAQIAQRQALLAAAKKTEKKKSRTVHTVFLNEMFKIEKAFWCIYIQFEIWNFDRYWHRFWFREFIQVDQFKHVPENLNRQRSAPAQDPNEEDPNVLVASNVDDALAALGSMTVGSVEQKQVRP